jgi:hypothetical protein
MLTFLSLSLADEPGRRAPRARAPSMNDDQAQAHPPQAPHPAQLEQLEQPDAQPLPQLDDEPDAAQLLHDEHDGCAVC